VGHPMRCGVPVVKLPAQRHRLNRLVDRQLKGQAAIPFRFGIGFSGHPHAP
jgi:hypothetical protein